MKDQNGIRTVLSESTLEKDLGVLISRDLKVADQCNKAAKKGYESTGHGQEKFQESGRRIFKDDLLFVYQAASRILHPCMVTLL